MSRNKASPTPATNTGNNNHHAAQHRHHHGTGRIEREDAELYDRQIRLFGAESQQRLFSSNVLIVGYDDSIAEMLKDLLLAGVRSVHLMDFQSKTTNAGDKAPVTVPEPAAAGNAVHRGVDMILALNPPAAAGATESITGGATNGNNINVDRIAAVCQAAQCFNRAASLHSTSSYAQGIENLAKLSFLKQFEVVIISLSACKLELEQIIGVAELCREAGTGVIVAITSAFYGIFLCDYGDKFYYTRRAEDPAGESNSGGGRDEKRSSNKRNLDRMLRVPDQQHTKHATSGSAAGGGSLELPESLLRYPPLSELLQVFSTQPLNKIIPESTLAATTAPPKKRSRMMGREVGKITAYALIQAVIRFYNQHVRLPRYAGQTDDAVLLTAFEHDLRATLQELGVVQRDYKNRVAEEDEEEQRQLRLLVQNFCSAGSPEYFWVQTLMGAELAQEVMTVLMRDSAPTRNIFFFDGAYEQVDFGKSAHIGCAPNIIRTTHEAPAIQLFVPLRPEFEASNSADAASTAGTLGDDDESIEAAAAAVGSTATKTISNNASNNSNSNIETVEDEEEELKDELRRKQQSTHPIILLETD